MAIFNSYVCLPEGNKSMRSLNPWCPMNMLDRNGEIGNSDVPALSPKMLLSELDQPEICEQNWICHSLSTHDIYSNKHISYIVYIYIF
jgi:hypothetical protein